jgi:hypothetical protein
MAKICCKDCQYYHAGVYPSTAGECRRRAPVFSLRHTCAFPRVREDCWCGEFVGVSTHNPEPVRQVTIRTRPVADSFPVDENAGEFGDIWLP